jgi:hypothetical protein
MTETLSHGGVILRSLAPVDLFEPQGSWTDAYGPRYADSWLYALRVTRSDSGGPGMAAGRGNIMIGVGVRGAAVHLLLLHPPRTRDDLVDLTYLCEALQETFPGRSIILRKVPQALASRLQEISAAWIDAHRFVSPSDLEDDAIDETVCDLDVLESWLKSDNHVGKALRSRCRRFARNNMALETIVPDKLSQDVLATALTRVAKADPVKVAAYTRMLGGAALSTDPAVTVTVFAHNGEYHGLYLTHMLTVGSAGLYCALSSRAVPGITEWMDTMVFRELHERGVGDLYFGGSETAGVARYVSKFPVRPPRLRESTLLLRP